MSTSGNAGQVLELFPAVETLRAGHLTLNPAPGQTTVQSIVDILSVEYCTQLQDIEVGDAPSITPPALITWLTARSSSASGCNKLKRVIARSVHTLPKKSRTRIAAIVDEFKWKRPIHLSPIYTPPGAYAPLPPVFGAPAQAPSAVPTPDAENSSWDEDVDIEEEPRQLDIYPTYAAPNNGPDDVTLQYCHSSLQGKWRYWTMPGYDV